MRMHKALHRAFDYEGQNTAYGSMVTVITMHRDSIRNILVHRACNYESPNRVYGCIGPTITAHRASIRSNFCTGPMISQARIECMAALGLQLQSVPGDSMRVLRRGSKFW